MAEITTPQKGRELTGYPLPVTIANNTDGLGTTNSPMVTKESNPLGVTSFSASRTGTLAGKGEESYLDEIVFDTTKPVAIYLCEFATNNLNGQFRLRHRISNGQDVGFITVSPNGSSYDSFYPTSLNSTYSSLWETLRNADGSYKYSLKNLPLVFPTGVQIAVRNTTSDPINIGCFIYGVEY